MGVLKCLGLAAIFLLFAQWSYAEVSATSLSNLEQGNQRFAMGESKHFDQRLMLKQNASSQSPSAVILSCMDSRVPPEIIFNQKIGSLFVIRNAGNVENPDVLASLEYATQVIHTPLIVVMGHTQCGAMAAACEKVKLGNITQLADSLQPPVREAERILHTKNCNDPKLVDEIARQNVLYQIKMILHKSPVIAKLVLEKKVQIVGAMFNLQTGKATLFQRLSTK